MRLIIEMSLLCIFLQVVKVGLQEMKGSSFLFQNGGTNVRNKSLQWL